MHLCRSLFQVLATLPRYLQIEVAKFLYKGLISKVPLFQDADPEFVRAIISNFKPRVYVPRTWVIRKGEIGREMYIIGSGQVEVVGDEDEFGNRPVFATLGEGSFFGEIALLMNQPRNASIRTLCCCELYMLTQESFMQVCCFL